MPKTLKAASFKGLLGDNEATSRDARRDHAVSIGLEQHPKRYPGIAAYDDSHGATTLYRRFAVLHAGNLPSPQVELTELEAQPDAVDKDGRGNDHMSLPAQQASGGWDNEQVRNERRTLIGILDKKLSGYKQMLSYPQGFKFRISPEDLNNLRTIGDWIFYGPNIAKQDQERHVLWQAYCDLVRRMLEDPQSNQWLEFSLHPIFYPAEDISIGIEQASGPISSIRSYWRSWASRGRCRRLSVNGVESRRPHIHINPRIPVLAAFNTIWVGIKILSTGLLYSVNIVAALGYLIFMNPHGSWKQSSLPDLYWQITLIAWLITIVIMIIHGVLSWDHSTKSYFNWLFLLSCCLCGIIAFAMHVLDANVMSGVLLGFTMSVGSIQLYL